MIIDRKLNLVIPIVREDQTKLYIHATPLHPQTFEQYYLVLAKAFSSLTENGLDPRVGPSVAARLLRDAALSTIRMRGDPPINWWEGDDGVGGPAGLMAGMKRLCNLLVPTETGWEVKPLAGNEALLSAEEADEVTNVLTFFMLASLVAPRNLRATWLEGLAVIYGLQTSYYDCMAFANSLRTSTSEETIGEKSPA